MALVAALAPRDVAKVRAVNDAYVAAWLRNDPAAIRAVFWPDAVLIPQGRAAIRGMDAIDRFWFSAAGPKTTVTGFAITTDEVAGSDSMALVRGTFVLDFEWEEEGRKVSRRNRGNYLNVLSRRSGEWRISHRMWGDVK